jgi:hypothetical protein
MVPFFQTVSFFSRLVFGFSNADFMTFRHSIST